MNKADRWMPAAAFAAVGACAALPVYNPDLFWHLSAARRMVETGAIPSADWLSFTMAGEPWVDFEWASQLLFWAAWRLGAFAGLWGLKAALLCGCAALTWRTLGRWTQDRPLRAAGLAVWAAANFTRSDIRPELFSLLGFGAVFLALESGWCSRRDARRLAVTAAIFCAWANLHAGFAYGLLLLGLYATGAFAPGQAGDPAVDKKATIAYIAAALAGTLLQPAGPWAYAVLWRHARDLPLISSHITEWGPIRLDNPWHWPAWLALFGSFGAALACVRARRPLGWARLAALLYFGFTAFQHARLAAYFVMIAIPLAGRWFTDAGVAHARSPGRFGAVCGMLIAFSMAYVLGWGSRFELFRAVFQARFVPVGAADFLEREAGALAGKPMYNPWGWGGYLGWRLHPAYRVFQDGRYIFHPQLAEAARAIESPDAWQGLLDRRNVEVAVLENLRIMLPTTRAYPDGSTRPIQRPYYAVFMPKERWALVHWDDKALVFARRGAASAAWLREREYRWARPFDDEALADALARGEVPAAELEAERARNVAE